MECQLQVEPGVEEQDRAVIEGAAEPWLISACQNSVRDNDWQDDLQASVVPVSCWGINE